MMQKQDARITRTLQLIRTAFLELLAEKGFEQMTVQDILDKTLINRSTFYKHFANKNEVVKKIVEEVKQIVKERLQKRFSIPTEDFIYSVRPIFEQQRQLIYLIGQIETPKIHLYNDIHQIVKADYIKRMSEETSQASDELDFQGHLFATITLGMMKYFIEKGELPQPDVLIQGVNKVCDLLVITKRNTDI